MREFIDITLEESIAERRHSVGWANLTDAEREITSVYLLHWHLLHGGLQMAINELNRNELDLAVAGLARIGAPNAAELITRAINDSSAAAVGEIESKLGGSEIGSIRLGLPQQYATSHSDEFPGPRSLVEQWESMQSRGIESKPDRLVDFERIAASDASLTDHRCATCGQPVPKYKSKCRRCNRVFNK